MDDIRQAWKQPTQEWRDPRQYSVDEQTSQFEAAVTGLHLWAENQVEKLKSAGMKTEDASYNLLSLRSFADATPGGRPDLPDMLHLLDLLSLLLSWGPHFKKVQMETVLVATHSKLALRKPRCPDDLYWLGFQAKQLNAFRNKALFVRKYPARIAHRMSLLGDGDLKSMLRLVQAMSWVAVLEPEPSAAAPQTLVAAVSPAPPATESDQSPSPMSPVCAAPSPSVFTPPPLTDLRIPSMFLEIESPAEPVQKKRLQLSLRHGEDLLAKAMSMPPRPVHYGAATENFGKKTMKVDLHHNLRRVRAMPANA